MTRPARDREDLRTPVYSLAHNFVTRIGTLMMPPNCCTDMSAAIELFQRIDPDVERINTLAGEREDTTYVRYEGKWHARQATVKVEP